MVDYPESMMTRILKKYPRFFDKSDESNNVKFIKGYAKQLKDLETNVMLIKLAKQIQRPLKIYRSQIMPHTYDMHFIVDLPDIKRVKIYKAGETDTLIFDSKVLPEGTNSYTYTHNDTDELNVIPTQKFYMTVEDYNENKLVKGFPHNDTTLGDEYDQDDVLDRIGNLLGVGRRVYRGRAIKEDEYPSTYPPYCIDKYEWDYCYERRLQEFVDEFEEKKLPVLELKKFFGVEPLIQGRWRNLCYMDQTDQDAKFMATDEWDYPVYDVTANLDDIPSNIEIPTEEDILKVLEKAFPLSKKVYFQLLNYLDAPVKSMILTDEVRKSLILGNDRIEFHDDVESDVDGSTGIHGIIFGDLVEMHQKGSFNQMVFQDSVRFIESYNAKTLTTDADWKRGTSSWMTYAGTGNASYLRNKFEQYSQEQAPDNARNKDTGGNAWNNVNNARYADGADAYSSYYAGSTDELQLWNYGFNIPSDAKISGIRARIRKWFYGSNNGGSVYLEANVNGSSWNYGKGFSWGQSWNVSSLGGDGDRWGRAWTPAEINSTNFGVGIVGWGLQAGYSAHVDYCYITVWWHRGFNAWWQSETINPDPAMYAWDNVTISCFTEPGYTTVKTEILNANTGTVLIPKTESRNIDISGINKSTPIKVKVYLDSNAIGYYPHVYEIKVNGKRYR